jgi:very-short-patch-repair endonuclease
MANDVAGELRRHHARRREGVPTVTLLAGPPGLAGMAWRQWADELGRAVVVTADPTGIAGVWLAAAAPPLHPAAVRWLAGVLNETHADTSARLAHGTRFDFDHLWRALPADTTTPVAVVVRAVFTDIPLAELNTLTAVRGVAELLGDRLPAVLVTRDRPADDSAWVLAAVRAAEPLVASVPALAVGVVASESEFAAAVATGTTRAQALAREGYVAVRGVTAGGLVKKLADLGLPAPPPDTLTRLTADGLSDAAAEAFVRTARTVNELGDARSAAEQFLFEQLNAIPATAGLFRLNRPLPFRHGPRPGEADLLAESLNLVVEVDGAYYHLTPDQYRSDREKDRLYQSHGYFVLRFLAEDVVPALDDIVSAVLDAVARRTPPTPP